MGRPRSNAFDGIRQHILDRAATLFAAHGYARTTMDGVAAACGVTKPTLYHYVRDKDDLLACIVDQHLDRLIEVVVNVRRQRPRAEDELQWLVMAFLQEYAGSRDKHRVLTEDVKFLPEHERLRVVDKERELLGALVDALCVHRPEWKRQQMATPVALLLFGMINWLFTWWDPAGPLGPEALGRLIDDLLANGLAGLSPSAVHAGT